WSSDVCSSDLYTNSSCVGRAPENNFHSTNRNGDRNGDRVNSICFVSNRRGALMHQLISRGRAFALAALFLGAAHAIAQENSGNVYGQVVDEKGAAVAGASLVLTGPNAPMNAVADVNGRFHFLAIPPGTYAVTASAKGNPTWTHENVIRRWGKIMSSDHTMSSDVTH